MTGRLTKNPELKHTGSNVPVCEFTIATNRPVTRDGERKADFVTCVAWRKLAENLCSYQSKGNLIGIIGSIRTETFDKKDGTKGYRTYVLADEIEFLESKKTPVDFTETQETTEIVEETNPYEEFGQQISLNEEITDDSLPF